MASYVWPPGLPQGVQNGYVESIGANIIKTPMDQGPAKQRLHSKRPDSLPVTFFMTAAQVSILNTFIFDTIKGTARFDFTHPRTNSTVEVRIVVGQDGELYKANHLGLDFYNVTMTLEILP